MKMSKTSNNLQGIKIYLETEQGLEYVGLLTRSNDTFRFQYDAAYLQLDEAIPLGPEMPLRMQPFISSRRLFTPFLERLPPKTNPAYETYCRAKGITSDESDPLVLISTLGYRGPSSLIFEPWYTQSNENWHSRLKGNNDLTNSK